MHLENYQKPYGAWQRRYGCRVGHRYPFGGGRQLWGSLSERFRNGAGFCISLGDACSPRPCDVVNRLAPKRAHQAND